MRIILTLFLAAFLVACKKDKLIGDQRSRLVGTWEWYMTHEYIGGNPGLNFYHYSSAINETYKLEFEENGKVYFYRNGSIEDKYRIVFASERIWPDENNGYSFTILLNNSIDNQLKVFIYGSNSDSLMVYQFPYSPEDSDLNPPPYFFNYFVKVE